MAFFWSHGSSSPEGVPVVFTEQGHSEVLGLLSWLWSPGWLSSWFPTPVVLGEPQACGVGGRGSQDDRRSGNEIQGSALTVDSFLKPPLT